ncbi:pullulanase-type alpha-1,6-glucosidase [Thalassotalea atypica]|uniref:pullulanase-type alpha-1,6-glucosidase n=1 Tax=Thalassotalea atypica TaxID=2054316 RepID=UPI002573D789|nr:pullulanase-type alpha-1,6-glucosidase [Thalassotalea atypica]
MKRLSFILPLLFLSACGPSNNETANTASTSESKSQAASTLDTTTSKDFSAHWLSQNILLLANVESNNQYQLTSVIDRQKASTALKAINTPNWVIKKYPHLQSFQAFEINIPIDKAKIWLKHELYIESQNTQNASKHLAYVQTGEVLDDIYTSSTNDANEAMELGAVIKADGVHFALWAPTAKDVSVNLYNQEKQPLTPAQLQLVEDSTTGIWHGVAPFSKNNESEKAEPLDGAFYQYQLDVYHPVTNKIEHIVTTDPYSISLSTNSLYSQIVDLDHDSTQPSNWNEQQRPALAKPEDAILYEVHIRDFSASDQRLSNEENRGKYGAFTEKDSDAINHITHLRNAGLNHIHLLPAFDIGTVNEEKGKAIDLNTQLKEVCRLAPKVSVCINELDDNLTLSDVLKSFSATTGDAQALVTELKTFDKYNWGYDPFHYTVPEGSYAKNPEGKNRIVEFREMVQSIHNMGFRVVMDVVYNHTHQARLERTAVLDKIVPNYYQRLHPISGDIEQSTCCDNTATERNMMAKLMIDSLVIWARDYAIDGFRFDLMGHQPKDTMLQAREAVRAIDPDTYFYGEGWNFGEVANNRQFVQASQLELAGTEIGTFTDRLRDAIRGPGISVQGDDIRRNQGIGNGLRTKPNELNLHNEGNAPDYYLLMDQLRIGLAGNLIDFPIEDRNGHQVTGKDIPYGSQPTGYALDPADTINYISKHDNQTLWDNNQYRNATDLTTEERVRLHNQSLSFALMAQGIPFLHMGSELLRSKSYLRDSYDYSDWFNRVDFAKQTNFYNIGLPPAEKDHANWPLISALLDKNQGRDQVAPADIQFSSKVFAEFMTIRSTSPLFTLASGAEIKQQVSFLNTGKSQQEGLVVMSIVNGKTAPDKRFNEIMVLFNTSPNSQTFATELANGYQLHPVQQQGVDAQTKESKATSQGFSIPAFTTAVFVKFRG